MLTKKVTTENTMSQTRLRPLMYAVTVSLNQSNILVLLSAHEATRLWSLQSRARRDERAEHLADDLSRRAFQAEVARLRALPKFIKLTRARALEGERLRQQVNDVSRLHQTRLQTPARLVFIVQLYIVRAA